MLHFELIIAHELVDYGLQLCQRRAVELRLILVHLCLALWGPETRDLILVISEELQLSDVAVFVVPVPDGKDKLVGLFLGILLLDLV